MIVDLFDRGEDAKALFLHAEFDRRSADQFPVKLDRDWLVAGHAQARRLKVFDLRCVYLGAKQDVLKISDDLQITQTLEDNHVKQPIIVNGVFEKRKRASIEPSVADQDKGAFVDRSIFRFDGKTRRDAGGNLGRLNEITQWTKTSFEREARFLDHLRIESHPGELRKVFIVCVWKIDEARFSILNDIPVKSQIMYRQTEFRGKDVHGSHRQKAKGGLSSSEAVDDFVNRTVAAGGDDSFESFIGGAAGKRLRFARTRGRAYHAAVGNSLNPSTLPPRAIAALFCATRFNAALSLLRNVFNIAIDAGARFENPAHRVRRGAERL